ncbi:transposase [Paenibacillus sp. DYY-L-2]|uniref:transposase n=1 Tax=Paenibacillus sp. DYY-L-2 TaxID=3447013 RepID=UPI003F500F95
MGGTMQNQMIIMLVNSSRERKRGLIEEFSRLFSPDADTTRDKKHPSCLTCPHCHAQDNLLDNKRNIVAYGYTDPDKIRHRFHCKKCGRHFNEHTGTLFHCKKLRSHILPFLERMLNGETIRKTATDLGVSPTTINSWRQAVLRYIEKNMHLIQEITPQATIIETSTSEFKPSRKGLPKHCMIPETTQVLQFQCDRLNFRTANLKSSDILKPLNRMIKGENCVRINGTESNIHPNTTALRLVTHTRNVSKLDEEFARVYRRMRGVAQPNLLRYALWQCLLDQLNRLNSTERLHTLFFLCL